MTTYIHKYIYIPSVYGAQEKRSYCTHYWMSMDPCEAVRCKGCQFFFSLLYSPYSV